MLGSGVPIPSVIYETDCEDFAPAGQHGPAGPYCYMYIIMSIIKLIVIIIVIIVIIIIIMISSSSSSIIIIIIISSSSSSSASSIIIFPSRPGLLVQVYGEERVADAPRLLSLGEAYVCKCVCIYIYIYIYTHTYMYIYIYI